jgi:hypothetical protein
MKASATTTTTENGKIEAVILERTENHREESHERMGCESISCLLLIMISTLVSLISEQYLSQNVID